MKILLDPGHGGTDPGAIGNGLVEKDVVLDISNYLLELLRNAGYDVSATRTTDVFIELGRRSEIARDVGADLLISIHANAGGGEGSEIFRSITDTNPVLAHEMQANMVALGFRDRGVKTRIGSTGEDFYSILRQTVNLSNATPYLVETFFIDSVSDTNRYRSVGYQGFANALFDAIKKVHPITEEESGNGFPTLPGHCMNVYEVNKVIEVDDSYYFPTINDLIANKNGRKLKSGTYYVTNVNGNFVGVGNVPGNRIGWYQPHDLQYHVGDSIVIPGSTYWYKSVEDLQKKKNGVASPKGEYIVTKKSGNYLNIGKNANEHLGWVNPKFL